MKNKYNPIMKGLIYELRREDTPLMREAVLMAIREYEDMFGNRDNDALNFREQYRNTVLRNDCLRSGI